MRDHIKILGILNIIMGSLGALLGLVVLAVGGMAGVAGVISESGKDLDIRVLPVIAAVVFAIAVFFFVLSLPSIIGGWGLIKFKPWSRVLMIIVSIFNLFHVPLGTALGVYGIWVLSSDEGRRLLASGGRDGGTILRTSGYPEPAGYQPPPAPPTA